MPDEMLQKPFCRRRETPNIRAKICSMELRSFPRLINNRAMNLALEALIYATRIPLYDKFSPEYTESLSHYVRIKTKLHEWRDMDRFAQGFEVMDNYLVAHNVKPQEIYKV